MNSAQVKKVAVIFLFAGFVFLSPSELAAQKTSPEKKTNQFLEEEDEGPLIYKFEPDFLTSVERRKEEIKRTRAILDTLDISDRKRKRLLKDLYKNDVSERLSRVLIVETRFEDPEEKEN